MAAAFLQIGSAPPAPTRLVGREEDISRLKILLMPPETTDRGVVRPIGDRIKQYRHEITTSSGTLTQAQLAERAGLSEAVVKKAENGQLIKVFTAVALAKGLGKSMHELIAPAGDSVALQNLVVVRGLPGVGKSTIAAALAHDADLMHSFEGCLWASLGQSPDPLGQIGAWGRALGLNDLDRERNKTHARARLTAALGQRRLLLLIDDAWTAEAAIDLMIGGSRCATLITTRITDVADSLAPTENDLYLLDVLSEDNSVKLLERVASSVVAAHRGEARELAIELERLPLALQVAGHLLREEARNGGLGLGQLLQDLRDATRLLPKRAPVDMAGGWTTPPTVNALLRKSTDVLSEEARKCFAYLAPFAAKPATFDLAALDAVWKDMADAKQMAALLTARGLLEPIGSRFWVHALLIAHAKSILSASE
jgi:transcriptional regulator with XRE-family HTH domain